MAWEWSHTQEAYDKEIVLCERCVALFGEQNALPATETIPGILVEIRHLCAEHALEVYKRESEA